MAEINMTDQLTCSFCNLVAREDLKILDSYFCTDHYAEYKPILEKFETSNLLTQITKMVNNYEQALLDRDTYWQEKLIEQDKKHQEESLKQAEIFKKTLTAITEDLKKK